MKNQTNLFRITVTAFAGLQLSLAAYTWLQFPLQKSGAAIFSGILFVLFFSIFARIGYHISLENPPPPSLLREYLLSTSSLILYLTLCLTTAYRILTQPQIDFFIFVPIFAILIFLLVWLGHVPIRTLDAGLILYLCWNLAPFRTEAIVDFVPYRTLFLMLWFHHWIDRRIHCKRIFPQLLGCWPILPWILAITVSITLSVYPYRSWLMTMEIIRGLLLSLILAARLSENKKLHWGLILTPALIGLLLMSRGYAETIQRILLFGWKQALPFSAWVANIPPDLLLYHLAFSILLLVIQTSGETFKPGRFFTLMSAFATGCYFALHYSFPRLFLLVLFLISGIAVITLRRIRTFSRSLPAQYILPLLILFALVISTRFLPASHPSPGYEIHNLATKLVQYTRLSMVTSTHSPIFGTGLNTHPFAFPEHYYKYSPWKLLPESDLRSSPCGYLEMFNETGLIGLGSFLFLLITLTLHLLHSRSRPRHLFYRFALVLFLIGFSLDNLTSFRLGRAETGIFFWLFLAIILSEGLFLKRLRRIPVKNILILPLVTTITLALGLDWCDELSNRILLAAKQDIRNYESTARHAFAESAHTRLQSAHGFSPWNPHLHFLLGQWHEKFGKPEMAESCYRKVLTLTSANAYYLHKIGDYHRSLRHDDRAIILYQQSLARNRNREQGVTFAVLGELLLEHGKGIDADIYLTEALKINPRWIIDKPASAIKPQTGKYMRTLLPRLTDRMFSRARQHPQEAQAYLHRLGKAFGYLGRYHESLAIYRYLWREVEPSAVTAVWMSRTLMALRRVGEAKEVLLNANTKFPNQPLILNELATLAFVLGDFQQAYQYCTTSITRWNSRYLDNHLASSILQQISHREQPSVEENILRKRVQYNFLHLHHQVWEQIYYHSEEDPLLEQLAFHNLLH